MSDDAVEHKFIMDQLVALAQGIGKTFAPFCEVVVHDLSRKDNAIVHIENGLTGRKVGDPVTELGLARLDDPQFDQVVANYENQLADGRQLKSTSVGIRGSGGQYVAALCMNIDLTQFTTLQLILEQFGKIEQRGAVRETLEVRNVDRIRRYIDEYAAGQASTPRSLDSTQRRKLLRGLKSAGLLEIRHASSEIAKYLNVSRATIYNDIKTSHR